MILPLHSKVLLYHQVRRGWAQSSYMNISLPTIASGIL